jgi:hypothetical protein
LGLTYESLSYLVWVKSPAEVFWTGCQVDASRSSDTPAGSSKPVRFSVRTGLSFARPGSHSQCLPRPTATHDTGINASKMMEYPKRKFVTAVTSSEAGSEHVNRAVDTDAPSAPNLGSCSCRSGQALVSNPPDETGLPAPCCCGRRRGRGASSAHRVRARASALAGVRSTARSPRGRRPSTARRRALRDRTRGRATAARGGRASSIFEGSGPGSDGIGRRYGTYACRHCHRALHASQKNNQIGRKRLQASKLRLDLGGLPDINESFPTKPKWIRKRRRFRK